MTYEYFVWTDLSTYDMDAARSDYAAFFGWTFHGDGSYDIAVQGVQEIAAIFPMPSRLADMNMPSFWMSYVHVEDVAQMVEKARNHDNAIIEIEPHEFNSDARIALVRDPSGAGFTLYQGEDITPPIGGQGQVVMRYHHVSDIKLIAPFYQDLFGWSFQKIIEEPWPLYDIRHRDGSIVAQAEEVPETVRGTYRYWMPCFTVQSMENMLEKLTTLKGHITSDLSGDRLLVRDRQGGHFMICEPVSA